jgi:hypothetical protein
MRSSRFVALCALWLSILFSVQSSFAGCLSIVIPTPNANNYDSLNGTFGTNMSDIWAVGSSQTNPGDLDEQSLVEHFNGSAWSVVPSPNNKDHPGNVGNRLEPDRRLGCRLR